MQLADALKDKGSWCSRLSSFQPVQNLGAQYINYAESVVSLNSLEQVAHQNLSEVAGIKFDGSSDMHESLLRRLWTLMFDGEDYEPKSRRWRTLGFQADDPRTDFRGGGLLSLQCLCHLAESHGPLARRWTAEANEEHSEYLFAAACVNVCAMLVVHLRLNQQPAVGPVRDAKPACDLALKRFSRRLSASSDGLEVFYELFVATMGRLHLEWRAFCAQKKGANLLHFGEVLRRVNVALDYAVSASDGVLILKEPLSYRMRTVSWLARARSASLVFVIGALRSRSSQSFGPSSSSSSWSLLSAGPKRQCGTLLLAVSMDLWMLAFLKMGF